MAKVKYKCVDVSTWQGDIDWVKVKKAGYNHAILRAGFGRESSQVDNQFAQNYKNAKAAGVKLGVYWYSYAVGVTDAEKEAKACLSVLKGKTLDMPVFFDMEEQSMTKLGKATLTLMAKAFCDIIIKSGYRAGIYSNPNWFTNYLYYNELKGRYALWLAQWASAPQLDCDIWQYSSKGTVPGIKGSVDMNYIYNDSIVATAKKPTPVTVDLKIAAVQALLYLANDLDVIKTIVGRIDGKQGSSTDKAIKEMKKELSLPENTTVDLNFLVKTYSRLSDSIPISGDVNGDGVVNIKDVTTLQKEIAGLK